MPERDLDAIYQSINESFPATPTPQEFEATNEALRQLKKFSLDRSSGARIGIIFAAAMIGTTETLTKEEKDAMAKFLGRWLEFIVAAFYDGDIQVDPIN